MAVLNAHTVIWTAAICLIGFTAHQIFLYKKHKALRRLKVIGYLWCYAGGSRTALDDYDEALSLCCFYGIMPKDFGFKDFATIEKVAYRSMKEYISGMNSTYARNYIQCLNLENRLKISDPNSPENDNPLTRLPVSSPHFCEYSRMIYAVKELAKNIEHYRKRLIEFKHRHSHLRDTC